jgi:hypothetical protein
MRPVLAFLMNGPKPLGSNAHPAGSPGKRSIPLSSPSQSP